MGNPVIVWDRTAPLAQVRGESKRANQALRDYAHMGAERSLRKLHERYVQQMSNDPPTGFRSPTTSFTTLSTWSLKYDWVARSDRFDDLVAADAEASWRKRREKERKEEWQLARILFRRARTMLEYPLIVEAEDEDGMKTQRPTNWRMADAAKFIDLAAKLARLAAVMRDDDPAETTKPEVVFYIPENGRPIRRPDD